MPANDYAHTIPFAVTTTSTIVGPFVMGDYAWASVQVSAQATGSPVANWEVSNDNANWVSVSFTQIGNGTALVSNTGSTGIFAGGVSAFYFRVRFSGTFSSGSTTGVVSLLPASRQLETGLVYLGGGGVVSTAASASGGYSKSNITTATTTVAKSGAGTLHAINLNTLVASATVTVYDNTAASGTKIGTITLPSTITGDSPFTLIYDVAFATGLTVVTSGLTDVTVSYA